MLCVVASFVSDRAGAEKERNLVSFVLLKYND